MRQTIQGFFSAFSGKRALFAGIVLAAFACSGTAISANSVIVEFTVTETAGIARSGEPVTSGIPIPRNLQIKDISSLRLVRAGGAAIPAQFTSLARWGASPGNATAPIRWLLLDFQADLTANGTATYYLQTTGAEPSYPTLVLTEDANRISINTGAAEFSISKTDGTLNGPGLAAPISAEALDGAGINYTAAGPVTVSIGMSGKMRASVKVEGAYRDDSANKLVDYTSRFWFYAGASYVRLFHTVENNTPCPLDAYEQISCFDIGSAGSVTIADLSLTIKPNLTAPVTYRIGAAAEVTGALSSNLLLYQDSSGTDHWNHYSALTDWDGSPLDARPRMQGYVSFRGYRITADGDTVASGNQAEGWVSVSGSSGEWAVAVRDFWQNFPKALRVSSDGDIEIGLFPDEFGPSDYRFTLRPGEHKTHEILLYPISETASLHKSFNYPLRAEAPPSWYVNSHAFSPTAPVNSSDWPDYEDYVDSQLTTSPAYEAWMDWHPNVLAAIERTDFYGIFDYGDVPIDYEGYGLSPLNLKYHMDYGMWLQWIRGGDQRWFNLAEAADRHTADIDILHNLHSPRHWSDGIMFGHSAHDESGFTNPHRNANSGSPDMAFGVPGLLATYYLTGYENAYDAAIELADCIEWRLHHDGNLAAYYADSNGTGYAIDAVPGMYSNNCRPAANCLLILVEAYRATADSRYLTAANALIDWAKSSDQPYIAGPPGSGGEEDFVVPQMLNMYCLGLGNYLTMSGEFGLADSFDALGSLLGYQSFLRSYAWIDLTDIAAGSRGAYPYHWYFDGRTGVAGEDNDNSDAAINNWLLVGADAMAYAYSFSDENSYFERATRLFRTGSRDPWFEGDANTYSATKEAANSVFMGQVFLHEWAAASMGPGLNPTGTGTDLSQILVVDAPLTLTITAAGTGTISYRFYVGAQYGGPWSEVQPWSANNSCTYTPAGEGNYVFLAHVSDDPGGGTSHQAGFSFATSGHGEAGVVINSLSSTLSFPQTAGTPINFTAQALGAGTIYFKFWYKDTGGWHVLQDWSADNTATWTPTQAGTYTIVVWANTTPDDSIPNRPIAGFTCAVGG